jgi:hypothetical protein
MMTRNPPRGRPRSRRRALALLLVVSGGVSTSACKRGEPPSWDGGSLSVAPLPLASGIGAPLSADAASPTDAAAEAKVEVDPSTLPQTRERPREGPPFQARAEVLWEAIVKDDAEIALPFFFPVGAYKQVKAIPSPESDWKRRLVAAYRRDIHKLHEKLGPHRDEAKLVELEVATERARWVEPGEESNKIGYWRVFGSKLRYQTERGAGAIDVSSLISWRGEWYVVHLAGFK